MKTAKPKKGFMDGYKYYDTSNGFGDAREWQNAFHKTMTGDEAAFILKMQNSLPHEILGVSDRATMDEIKKAYYKLLQIWHPDKNPHNITNATEMTKKIIASFTTLKNQHDTFKRTRRS